MHRLPDVKTWRSSTAWRHAPHRAFPSAVIPFRLPTPVTELSPVASSESPLPSSRLQCRFRFPRRVQDRRCRPLYRWASFSWPWEWARSGGAVERSWDSAAQLELLYHGRRSSGTMRPAAGSDGHRCELPDRARGVRGRLRTAAREFVCGQTMAPADPHGRGRPSATVSPKGQPGRASLAGRARSPFVRAGPRCERNAGDPTGPPCVPSSSSHL